MNAAIKWHEKLSKFSVSYKLKVLQPVDKDMVAPRFGPFPEYGEKEVEAYSWIWVVLQNIFHVLAPTKWHTTYVEKMRLDTMTKN